ncbi:MAG: histidine kinase [Acidobacteria bacterium]|nr:histidine kinase [Acidobacteriota bacterium]
MPRRSRAVVFVLLGALAAAAFSTTLAYFATRLSGKPQPPEALGMLNLAFWFGWAVLCLPLAMLVQRLRIDRRPQVAVPVHLAAVVVASLLHIALLTTAQTSVWWLTPGLRYDGMELPAFGDQWLGTFPLQLASTLDWELFAGAGIVAVAHAFFYYAESRERGLRQANLETRLMEAQLQTLQRQLHPHFLFNTLNAISTLMHRDVDAADRTLVQLSGLLRVTLDSIARPQIRLSEELDFLDKFVQIEQTRLGDRLSVTFDVDADTLDGLVPALILQPLVENAIKYGVAPTGKAGTVSVTGHLEGDMLVLSVTDDGPGPSEPALAALSTGIGLSNTRARLSHQFGVRHRFEFKRHHGGFTVMVAFPFRTVIARVEEPKVRDFTTGDVQETSEWPCPPEKSVR